MSDIAIKVEDLSKLYQLGSIGTGTIRNDLQRWWASVRGKEDPFVKIGQVNERTKKAESNFVWALKDIDFEVKKGEVLGIIGRNGAGKSTLLKILSKITTPTTGTIKVDGRIASLLEVGTGFHPELSGRENIFMNGAILGMRKWEIQKKFDEIVDFAGVEAYIDTPVKRYSSGMYVRLAFAVAAFLEPEILIVDEVLAVGDAEFQKKCLGRMKDVSVNDGRTVLFVSHNLQAIQKLCTSGLYLNSGRFDYKGDVQQIIEKYLEIGINQELVSTFETTKLSKEVSNTGFAKSVVFEDINGLKLHSISVGQYWRLKVNFQLEKEMESFIIAFGISTSHDVPLYTTWSKAKRIAKGTYEAIFVNDKLLFASGSYRLSIGLSNYEKNIQFIENALYFEILDLKEEWIKNDARILRTSGAGLVLNPLEVSIIRK